MKNQIVIFSLKGGVGKSSLSYIIYRELQKHNSTFKYITNDYSNLVEKINLLKNTPRAKFSPNNIEEHNNTLYDFGGFESPIANKISTSSDLLIIPITNDFNACLKAMILIDRFKEKIARNEILIVANNLENKADADILTKIFSEKFPEIPIRYVRRTKLFKNAIDKNMSLDEIVTETGLSQDNYKHINEDLKALVSFIKTKLNNNQTQITNNF
jgi:cellulose biosynthesis protein BcsQ